MAINENVYGAKELWTAPFGDATNAVNTIKIANYNLASPNAQTRFWCQMYTNTTPNYTIFNNWDNRNNTIIDDSIVPFGIGSGSGLSHIDWYTIKNGVVSETPSNSDNRQITNIAFSYDDHMSASTWCLDGEGSITGGTATAQTYNQRLCYNRWSNLYGTAFSTGSSSAGGGSARFTTSWYNSRLFTYLPTKNLVLTPRATIVNASGTSTTYTKISDIIAHKNDGKLIRFGVKFSYKPTGTRTDIPIAPFFMDDSNVQKGFANYPVPTGETPQIVDHAIKLPIIYNRSNTGFFILLGTGAYDNYISVPTNDTTHNYTWATFQGNKIKFEPEIINSRMYMSADISQLTDAEIESELLTQMAYMGMLFVTDEANVAVSIYDEKMYCGEIKDGITTGNYTNGTANLLQPQMQWDDYFQSGYSPDNPPNIIPPSDPTTFNPVSLANGGLKRYVLNDANMETFGQELWNVIDTSDPDELIQNQTLTNFLTNNPLDCIVSIKRFPLADMSQGTAVNPMLGKVKILNVLAYPFDASSTILSCGSLTIPRFFNDFRDYMVQYELILPFCGTLALDAESVTGKTIDVKYAIDYTTGTCTAWVLTTTSDGAEIVIDSANGNCCIDIPMSGVQTATLTGQIYNANENLKTAKFNTIVSGATGFGNFVQNVREHNTASLINQGANLINNIHNIQKAEWNIDHTEIPLKMIGASSGCNSFQIELTPRLTAYVPKTVSGFNYADYLHTVGASVCDSCTIGNYSGYAEISNVDLSGFTATTTEKNMISTLLSGGVYL